MIEIGKYNRLRVLKIVDFGLYLVDEEHSEEILLPIKYIPKDTEINDWLNVFVYNDSENRPIATTLEPYGEVGDFVFLKTIDVSELGAFVDLGIAKDVFVPFREQLERMEAGRWYIIYLYIDEKTGRIVGTNKWLKKINKENDSLTEGKSVDLLIAERTELGYKAIINNAYLGLIYHNEIFEDIRIGEIKKGFIKKIREENKIDLSLQLSGYENIVSSNTGFLEQLEANQGVLNFGDKSTPEEIYSHFKMSKKAFKKLIGGLYRDGIIQLEENKIKLITKSK